MRAFSSTTSYGYLSSIKMTFAPLSHVTIMSFKKRKDCMLAYQFEVSLEISRKQNSISSSGNSALAMVKASGAM